MIASLRKEKYGCPKDKAEYRTPAGHGEECCGYRYGGRCSFAGISGGCEKGEEGMRKVMRSPVLGICIGLLTILLWFSFKQVIGFGGMACGLFASNKPSEWVVCFTEQSSKKLHDSQMESVGAGQGHICGKFVMPGDMKQTQLGVRIFLNDNRCTDVAQIDTNGDYVISVPCGEYKVSGIELFRMNARSARLSPTYSLAGNEIESFYSCRALVISNRVVLAPRTLVVYDAGM